MLLKRFAVSDHATHQIGEMIHDADLEEGKFQRAECVGLDLLFKGWARLGLDDTEILEKRLRVFRRLARRVAEETLDRFWAFPVMLRAFYGSSGLACERQEEATANYPVIETA